MRFFLDTEFNGFGGELMSIALVPEYGTREYYAVLPPPEHMHPWVERHVVPYLDSVPTGLKTERLPAGVIAREIARFLADEEERVIVADWPDDIAYFCRLLMTGPGEMVTIGSLAFTLVDLAGFSTARNSKVPHNALHDARALRDFVLETES